MTTSHLGHGFVAVICAASAGVHAAVDLLQAAKAGDTAAFDQAAVRWDDNAIAIADLLASVNPRNWPQAEMRAAMKGHLDQTIAEAAHELGGDYAASVADYDVIHAHILAMADDLSSGSSSSSRASSSSRPAARSDEPHHADRLRGEAGEDLRR